MKAIRIKPIGSTLQVGQEYPYISTEGSNIQIDLGGYICGFSDSYLRIIDENTERRKELAKERDELTMEISRLKIRLDVVKSQIDDIDTGCTNQLRIAL